MHRLCVSSRYLQMPSHQEIYVIIKYNSTVTAVPEGWQYAAYIFLIQLIVFKSGVAMGRPLVRSP